MRRFYVTTKAVWGEPVPFGEGLVLPRFNLFHPAVGSHYIDLPNGHILLSADFHSEWCEETWHAHPEVARLPHPVYEGKVTLSDLVNLPEHEQKQFRPHHLDALGAVGIQEHHTVWDVHRIASAIYPLVRLSNTY